MLNPQYEKLAIEIERLTGFRLEADKEYLVPTRLAGVLKEYNLATYNDLAFQISQGRDRTLINLVIDQMTTHETRFFRDESTFDALAKQIVPEWMDRKNITPMDMKGETLKIWCAGCSFGQEPYSIMMMIQDSMPFLSRRIQITATDLSQVTLEKAKKGIYSKFEIERGLPEKFKSRYFTVTPEGNYQIQDGLKTQITWKEHNLVQDPYPSGFDIIFCRNVIIYFPEHLRKDIFKKFRSSLSKDGAMILGASESLFSYIDNYVVREFGLARYYEFPENVTFF